jgi:preprotein translocase subunit SecF
MHFPIRIFSKEPSFDFMGRRWAGFIISAILTVGALGLVATKGLNLGIDFTGGILMEVHTEQEADLGSMREALSGGEFGEVSLQNSGSVNDVMIRIQVSEDEGQAKTVEQVREILLEVQPGVEFRKTDYVGPTVGRELMQNGIIATILSFAAIMVYVWFRFEWQYGTGAILALLHDTIMVIGFFAVTRYEFGLTAIAAVLTIIGYSINDSVVIYDRIRENLRRFKKKDVSDLLNISINETLSRTILTASTTLLASLALFIFGGDVIRGFSGAMVFGVIVGTYSSIYISAPALLYLNIRSNTVSQQPQEA